MKKKEIENLLSRFLAGEIKSNTKEYNLAYYYANKDKMLSRSRKLYKERHKEKKAKYRLENSEKNADYFIKWRQKNPEYMSKYMKRRRIEKPAVVKAEEREKTLTRSQPLLKITKYFEKEIDEIYNNCPKDLVVDHIIPLQGKNVTGLNVPWNMQYLTKSENNFKRNSFDLTYENDSWKMRYKKVYS